VCKILKNKIKLYIVKDEGKANHKLEKFLIKDYGVKE